jgi:hypothetical protein
MAEEKGREERIERKSCGCVAGKHTPGGTERSERGQMDRQKDR